MDPFKISLRAVFVLQMTILNYIVRCQPVVNLTSNSPVIVTLAGNVQTELLLDNIVEEASYIVCQVHTQYKNITVSYQRETTPDSSVTGCNIGIITILNDNQTSALWYLTSKHNESISVMVTATMGTGLVPLPGGCNMEMNLELDANLMLEYNSDRVSLKYQFANIALGDRRFKIVTPFCEDATYQNYLQYDLYVYYLSGNDFTESSYFDALKKMMTPKSVISNGVKLKSTKFSETLKPNYFISSYTGQGVVYNMVVKQKIAGSITMAAYVPMATYSCDLNQRTASCYSIGAMGKILAVAGGIVGLFICFLGHRFFKTGLFVFAFIGFNIVFYIILGLFASTSIIVQFVLSAVFSIVGATLWLMLWWYWGMAALSVLLTGLVSGYLISSIIFFTPFGNMEYWEREVNYGLAFTCGVLVIPVIILAFTKVLNILSCAFIGSYLFVITLDVFLYGGLKNIILNSIRHAVNKDYMVVMVTGKFTTVDIVLTYVWAVLFIFGSVVQFVREKGRDDFPECRRQLRAKDATQISRYQRLSDDDDNEAVTERSHLINETRGHRIQYTEDHSSPFGQQNSRRISQHTADKIGDLDDSPRNNVA